MIQSVLVVGAGSAGLMAALALKRKIPQLSVRILRDPDTPVIGVGESTTPNVPTFLFDFLKLRHRHFYATTRATWKIGIHFLWGPRPCYEYGFTPQLDAKWPDLPKPNGYYCDEDFSLVDVNTSLMAHRKSFVRNQVGGGPWIHPGHAYHIYNPTYVQFLEECCREEGITFTDTKLQGVEKGPQGVTAVVLSDGRKMSADFFIDASGFRSELLGRALNEPFISYGSSLFCDRAIVGSWDRTDEPTLPYTTAETMDAGWCWRIEHQHAINRGYVFCSNAMSDDEAHAEFMRKNPKARTWEKSVKFRSGRYRRVWVDNVVAMGNASGFVEPLEATALMAVCAMCQNLVEFLIHTNLDPSPTIRDLYNEVSTQSWDDIRNFLSLHYRYNTRLQTPFWKRAVAEVDVSGIQHLLDFYAENGPTGLARNVISNVGTSNGLHSAFGIEGYLVHLVGLKVPYKHRHVPTAGEWQIWNRHRSENSAQAAAGLTVEESLAYINHPAWMWASDPPMSAPVAAAPRGLNVVVGTH